MILLGLTIAVSAQQPAAPLFRLKQCTELPDGRQMHGAAVVGPRLYVFGGGTNRGGWDNSVISAEITPDGNLGQWRSETPMPERRHYIGMSIEVVNNRIYIIGGTVAAAHDSREETTQHVQTILWTTVRQDGSLESWRISEPFPGTARSCLATSSNDRFIYVIAGATPQGITDSVLRATIGPDNSPGQWTEVSKLPTPLWFHGAAIMDNTIYVWGGLTAREATSINPNVYAAQVLSDGSISQWQTIGKMPVPVYSSAFCGFNDYLVCVAGRYAGGTTTNDIWYSRLAGGVPSPWQIIKSDLEPRVYISLGLDKTRGWIFIPGGRFRDETNTRGFLSSKVQGFQLAQPQSAQFQVVSRSVANSASAASVTLYPLVEALARLRQEQKPILVFFHSPNVPAAKRAWETISADPEFARISQSHIWAEVDISREAPSLVYEYGVFKVPAVVKIGTDARRRGPAAPVNNMADLKAIIAR
jgi:N-acetylneuraminic acid mutarotase